MLISKILIGMKSLIKCIIYKIVYRKKIDINNKLKCYFGNNSKISLGGKNSKITIGENFMCKDFVRIKSFNGEIRIGTNVYFNDLCSINCRNKITIGDNCLFGENVKLYDHDHKYNEAQIIRESGFVESSIQIGKNVWIGSDCIILKGSNIGDNVVVAAGTIIRGNIVENSLVYNDRTINIKEISRNNL